MFGIKTKIGLRAKFIVASVLLVLLITVAFSIFFTRRQNMIIHAALKERGAALAMNLAYNCEYGVLTANSIILTNLIDGVFRQPDVAFCVVRDTEKNVLAAKGLKGELNANIDALQPAQADEPRVQSLQIEGKQDHYVITAPVNTRKVDIPREEQGLFLQEDDWIQEAHLADKGAELSEEGLLFEEEKSDAEEKIGTVIIGISLAHAAGMVRETRNAAVEIAFFIVLLSSLIIILLSRILIDPIRRVAAGTVRIAGGDLDFKVHVKSGDELGQLTDSFNKMIVDLKRYQDELIEAKEYTSNIIESMIDTLIVVDPRGRIKTINKATVDLLGYEEEEIFGTPISELFVQEDRKELDFNGGENENPGDTVNVFRNVEKTYLAKDGRRIPVRFSSSLIHDKNRMLTGIVCVTRDITKLKEAEELAEKRRRALEDRIRKSEKSRQAMLYMVEDLNRTSRELQSAQDQLVRSERLSAIGELAGGVAHELRNSLGVLTNAVAYLKLAIPMVDQTVKNNFNHMKENVARANKVISDLLDFARDAHPAKSVFPISAVTDSVLKDMTIPGNIEVEKHWPEEVTSLVYADQDHVYHIIFNLLKNAVEAMATPIKKHPGGRLAINCLRNGEGKVVFSVSDTGIGISPADKDKIFNPLFTGKSSGIGLGLSISRRYTELNGGSIEAESEEGSGSTFILTLPGGE